MTFAPEMPVAEARPPPDAFSESAKARSLNEGVRLMRTPRSDMAARCNVAVASVSASRGAMPTAFGAIDGLVAPPKSNHIVLIYLETND